MRVCRPVDIGLTLVGHLRLQLDEEFCTYLMPTIYATVADEVMYRIHLRLYVVV